MPRPVPLTLALMLLATVFAGASAGADGLATAGCLWGVVLLGAIVWRLRREDQPRPVVQLCIGFAVANGFWLASDALRLWAPGRQDAGTLTPADGLSIAGVLLFCWVITRVGRLRGSWPNTALLLNGSVLAIAVFVPLWFAVIAPLGAPPALVLWGVGALLLLGVGATYVLGPGVWNLPAVLLGAGVVGNFAIGVALHLASGGNGAAPAAEPAGQYAFGFVVWTIVALHPELLKVFEGGHREGGVPLMARVWMTGPTLMGPVGVLCWAYIFGEPLPVGLIVVSFSAILALIAGRAYQEYRTGKDAWHVPLTITATTLVAALAAMCLAFAGQSAQRAQERAERLADNLPTVSSLDAVLLRATGDPSSRAPGAAEDWSNATAKVRRGLAGADPELAGVLDAYVRAGRAAIADRGVDERMVDGTAGAAYRRLVDRSASTVARERARGDSAVRRARVLTVLALVGALIGITGLLLHFSFAGRRLATAYLERHDALTGLPNRTALEQRLGEPRDSLGALATEQALVLLDLDDFKTVNDVRGHPAGDALLRAVAERLAEATGAGESLARVDGDAFAVVVSGPSCAESADRVAAQMQGALLEPFELEGQYHVVHGSIGIAMRPSPSDADCAGEDLALTVLRNAELAMYEAKKLPGTAVVHFSQSMHDAASDRLALTADLRAALERDELHLVYQPIVDLETGRALGYEALARWNHPERGPLAPAEFIPLAEATGLVVPLGGWALREACRQLQAWQQHWDDVRYVSVNVAGQQLAAGGLLEQVSTALQESGLPPEQLLLEVTESSLIENVTAATEQMAAVKALGVRFALDDFGTGYSSLSYLRQFRVDVVKVDKSFIDGVIDDDGSSLVEAIIHMAASLRMKVVAEGIEADDQADELRRLGCALGQGFRFSRPLSASGVSGAPPVFGLPPSVVSPLRVARGGDSQVA